MAGSIKTILAVCLILFLSFTSYAQTTKVVVIPMAGDDIVPKPFAPLTKQSPPSTDYIITASTVIDRITGLEWQRVVDNTQYTWTSALQYCIDLGPINGKSDWRLPLIEELQSIVDYEPIITDPTINVVAFPSTNATGYWSASSASYSTVNAWVAFFSHGHLLACRASPRRRPAPGGASRGSSRRRRCSGSSCGRPARCPGVP